MKFLLFSAVLYLFVIYNVSILRDRLYNEKLMEQEIQQIQMQQIQMQQIQILGILNKILNLAGDRWLGLEGVMAVSSYDKLNFELLKNSLIEKSQLGKINIYQYISNSHYKDMDNNKFSFGTIPGPIAFLYYSGSLIIVFFGMFLFTILLFFLELLVNYFYKSAILVSYLGIYFANIVAQFGILPINTLKSMFFTFSFLIFLKLFEIKKSKYVNY